MKKKNREDLDKYLRKFAVKGQEKLVGQLRQMLNPKRDEATAKGGELDKLSSNEFIGRKKLFELMDTFRNKAEKYGQSKEKGKFLWFELLCKPIVYPDNIDLSNLKKTQQTVSNSFGSSSDSSVFMPENGILYARSITPESLENSPDVFDPKVQSITIAESLIFLGRLYQSLGLNFRDRFDIAFRYNNATDLAIGSISPETFLPSTKYKEENLTFYIVRELYELLGQTADITAEIIIEILKKLHYQGIVNKDFFVHAVSKHLAQK